MLHVAWDNLVLFYFVWCICVCVCVYIYIYVYVYVCVYIYIYIYIYYLASYTSAALLLNALVCILVGWLLFATCPFVCLNKLILFKYILMYVGVMLVITSLFEAHSRSCLALFLFRAVCSSLVLFFIGWIFYWLVRFIS